MTFYVGIRLATVSFDIAVPAPAAIPANPHSAPLARVVPVGPARVFQAEIAPFIHSIEGVRHQFLVEPFREYRCALCKAKGTTQSRARKYCDNCRKIIQAELERKAKLRRRAR